MTPERHRSQVDKLMCIVLALYMVATLGRVGVIRSDLTDQVANNPSSLVPI